MDNKNELPKKNFASMQLDLSRFELASDEAKSLYIRQYLNDFA